MKEPEVGIPILFRCPISLDLFKDPVTLCTGQTYDRSSIEKWLSCGNLTCPVTMQKLHDSTIVPNTTLRHLIDRWLQINSSHGYDLDYFQTVDDSFVVLKHNLQSKESTLESKVEALDKVLALSKDLPFENCPLIQLDFFQMILELALKDADERSSFEENVMFVEKALVCGLKLLPFSDLGTLNMLKQDESKFTILFKKGSFMIKKSLCHYIVAISSSLQLKELLVMFGKSKILVQELVHLIENKLDGYEESIKALSALSSVEQNREVIAKENAVKALITYIVNAPKCEYRSLFGLVMAMKTIEALLVVESAKEDVLDHPNGVSEIVKMVFRVSSDNEASESAMNCLIILCQDFINAREEAICCGILTKLLQPIAIVAGLHYAAITDIAWSATGKYLALSSQDGYCTLLEFDNEELGSTFCRPEKEAAGDDKNSVLKQEETVPEIISSDKCMDIDSAKQEEKTEVKQESTISIPQIPIKAARKRITPMAID